MNKKKREMAKLKKKLLKEQEERDLKKSLSTEM